MAQGPVCTSFSRMGLQRGMQDEKFQTHESYYNASSLWDVMIIENVPEYSSEIPQKKLGPEWCCESCVLDPRLFGVPSARSRVYILAYRKSAVTRNSAIKIAEVIDTLTQQVVSTAAMFWWDQSRPESKLTGAQAI